MAIAPAQSRGTFASTSSATIALAYSGAVTSGRTLLCFVGWFSTTATCSVSDSVNGAWTAVGSPSTGTGGFNVRGQFFRLNSTASGTPTVTATVSGSVTYRILHIFELTGNDTVNPIDASGGASGSSTTPSAPVLVGAVGCALFGACYTAQTAAAGSGFTGLQNTDGNQSEWRIAAGTGSQPVAFTNTPSGAWLVVGVSIEPASGTGYTQNINDGIAGTDAVAKAPKQARNDGIAGTDARTTAWVATRTIADSGALTDATAKTAGHPVADAASLTDASARSVAHPQADAAALTDAAAKTAKHALADAGALTDSTAHAWAAKLPLADAGSLTDTANTGGATGHIQNIGDGITATDATAKTVKHPLADPLAGTDLTAKSASHPVADGIAGTDARAKTAAHPVADPVAATDALARAWAAKRTQPDAAALTDAVNTGGSTNHTRTINDALAGTDAIAKAPAHPVTDAISATDARARQIAVALAELAALTDPVARQWAAHLAIPDTATIGDLMVVNARRWLLTPQPHWQNNPTGTRWPPDPQTRWAGGTGTRWDIDPQARWPAIT